jgi:hypothetical protein
MIDENILRKIKKCLALGQSSEPAEAAAAMRQAQKLMAMHNVDQVALARHDIGEAEVKSKASVSRVKDWELSLLNTIAKAFGCQMMWISSNSYRGGSDVYGRYVLVGLKQQVQLASYTADVMTRKLIKARGEFVRTLPQGFMRQRKIVEADGFCHGWVLAVRKTVQEFAVPDETKRLIRTMIEEQTEDRNCKTQQREIGNFGANAGYVAGREESIHRPLNETVKKRLTKSIP